MLTVVLIGARRLAWALVAGAVAAGVPFALAGLATAPWVAMVLLTACGAGKLFFDVALRTFVQRLLPDRLLTAVFGLQESVMMGGIAVGSLAAPLLVTGVGAGTSFVVAGLFLPVVAVAAWWSLRRLDEATTVPEDVLALLQGVPIFSVLAPRLVERLALFSGRESHSGRCRGGERGRARRPVLRDRVGRGGRHPRSRGDPAPRARRLVR